MNENNVVTPVRHGIQYDYNYNYNNRIVVWIHYITNNNNDYSNGGDTDGLLYSTRFPWSNRKNYIFVVLLQYYSTSYIVRCSIRPSASSSSVHSFIHSFIAAATKFVRSAFNSMMIIDDYSQYWWCTIIIILSTRSS